MPRPKSDKDPKKVERQRQLFAYFLDRMEKGYLDAQADNLSKYLSRGQEKPITRLSIKRWVKGEYLMSADAIDRLARALDMPCYLLEGFLSDGDPDWGEIVKRLPPELPPEFRSGAKPRGQKARTNLPKDEVARSQLVVNAFKSLSLELKIQVLETLNAETEMMLRKLGLKPVGSLDRKTSTIAKMLLGRDLDEIASHIGIPSDRVRDIALGKPPPPSCNELSLLAAALDISGEEISAVYEAEFGKRKQNGNQEGVVGSHG